MVYLGGVKTSKTLKDKISRAVLSIPGDMLRSVVKNVKEQDAVQDHEKGRNHNKILEYMSRLCTEELPCSNSRGFVRLQHAGETSVNDRKVKEVDSKESSVQFLRAVVIAYGLVVFDHRCSGWSIAQ
ncbi:hypothetical protein AVEN_179495-1 [Araneus ventricosus]|uniref:Uncharacterized protein n=1 Tax=Araneus ventricosus TaxID=182803 RepID=A0A4Y2BH35_ARAVE|nr:hypothetical protein AVEN_179495-1 [Araneus ventricosus]